MMGQRRESGKEDLDFRCPWPPGFRSPQCTLLGSMSQEIGWTWRVEGSGWADGRVPWAQFTELERYRLRGVRLWAGPQFSECQKR